MDTLQDFELLFQKDLQTRYAGEEIRSIFSLLITEKFQINRTQYLAQKSGSIDLETSKWLRGVLQQLKTGKPIQYILQHADFFGLQLEVNESVLIPRPETEELVDLILKNHRTAGAFRLIDIGTGSGCIPIAIKKKLPDTAISALDISNEAIEVARRNAERFGTSINFINADILEWDCIFDTQQYDVIVSNPPYITPKEKEVMEDNVLLFEPHSALFVEESAPLLFYDTIASFAKKHLHPAGTLYFEINQYLGRETVDLFRKKGFGDVELLQDMQGADRMIQAKFTVSKK